MAMKIRLTGTKEEIDQSIEQIKSVLDIVEMSDYYKNSSQYEIFRVYIDAHLYTPKKKPTLASVITKKI